MYKFREADEKDISEVVNLFSVNDYNHVSDGYIKEKYFNNPYGRGRIFLMVDSNSCIKGVVGYIPLHIFDHENFKTAVMQSVDLLLAPETRGKKLFPKLQKFAMSRIALPLIAFPNKRSEIITIKLGWKRLAPIESWHLPVGYKVGYGKGNLRILYKTFNFFCTIYASFFLKIKHSEISIKPMTEFGDDVSNILCKKFKEFSTEYLNWRFTRNSSKKFLLLKFQERNVVIGYCVLSAENSIAVIYDLFTLKDERACLGKIFQYCKSRGFLRLAFPGIGLKLWRFGFIKTTSKVSLLGYNLPHKMWRLTLRDSDW